MIELLMRLSWCLKSSKFLFSLRNVPLFVVFINKWWNVWGKSLRLLKKCYFSDPVLLNVQKFLKVNWIIHPLWLDVLLGLFLDEVLSVSNDVSDIGIIFSQWNSSSIGKNDIFKRISWDFSAQIEMKSIEKKMFILLVLINKLLVKLILLIIINILSSNLLKSVALVCWCFTFDRWILQPDTWVEFKIDELHQDDVKVQKCSHNSVINIQWQVSWVLVRNQVIDFLVHYLHLVIDALDTHEGLLQCVCFYHVQLEMFQ